VPCGLDGDGRGKEEVTSNQGGTQEQPEDSSNITTLGFFG
jgi:hypothetical protein